MVLASFAGAAASATAATHHNPASTNRITPDPVGAPSGAFGLTYGARVNVPLASQTNAGATAAVAAALPTLTINDPTGLITNGSTVTVTLTGRPAGSTLTGTPTITPTGTGVSVTAQSVTATTVTFTVAVTGTTPAATYAVSGVKLIGATAPGKITTTVTAQSGASTPVAIALTPNNVATLGAVTNIAASAAGAEAPDTAAVLFRAAFPAATGTLANLVVATDYAPQDAESANYLAKKLGTGVVLTDPKALSTAVSGVLTQYTAITHIYIVGGTSVVSTADQSSLTAAIAGRTTPQVIRYSGATQYDTNQAILTAVAAGFPGVTPAVTPAASTNVALPFVNDATYNTSGGLSSPTSTATVAAKTAVIVSGDIRSFQDGVSSSAISFGDGLPVVLTTPTALSAGASAALSYGGYTQVIVLGGPLAVSDAVVSSLIANNINVLRVAGPDASATSALLASLETSSAGAHASTGLGFDFTDGTGVLLARGTGFQDALTAGPYAGGRTGAGTGFTPILLSENGTTLGGSGTSGLTGYLSTIGAATAFASQFVVQPLGGPLSVTPALSTAALNAEIAGVTP